MGAGRHSALEKKMASVTETSQRRGKPGKARITVTRRAPATPKGFQTIVA
jgi:hypothetical protein